MLLGEKELISYEIIPLFLCDWIMVGTLLLWRVCRVWSVDLNHFLHFTHSSMFLGSEIRNQETVNFRTWGCSHL
jgi:hypothetical protein